MSLGVVAAGAVTTFRVLNRVAVPEVLGNATLARGEKDVAVAVTGVEAKSANEIAPLRDSMVCGRLDLGVGNISGLHNRSRAVATGS